MWRTLRCLRCAAGIIAIGAGRSTLRPWARSRRTATRTARTDAAVPGCKGWLWELPPWVPSRKRASATSCPPRRGGSSRQAQRDAYWTISAGSESTVSYAPTGTRGRRRGPITTGARPDANAGLEHRSIQSRASRQPRDAMRRPWSGRCRDQRGVALWHEPRSGADVHHAVATALADRLTRASEQAPCVLSQSPRSNRERPGRGAIAFALAPARPALLQRHETIRQLGVRRRDADGHYGGPAGWKSKVVGTPAQRG